MIYDLIIIGGGPAGTAAAVYASRKRLETLLITNEWGGQSIVSEKIYNWIGSTSISGNELAENFKNHVLANATDSSTLKVKEGEKVKNLSKENDIFKITTEIGEEFLTKTVLIATGSGRRKLEAKNADTLEHKGLTYCASCDGPLFSGADVVVAGGGNAGFETAAQLLAYCNSVTLLHRSDTFRADEITVEKVSKNPKFKAIKNVDILEIKGDKFVEGLVYKDQKTGIETELKVTGIFVEIGQIPNTGFAKDIVPLNEYSSIKIDPKTQKTQTAGIWAAGDCTDVLYHQNNIAAGDAVRALEDIYLYIHTK
ncbi:MAG: Alkyl hydroperoxide reductase [Candidatus Nomurabacteria bacterium GW2011_GWA2_40_9]|uniref:Alkyl hydroperoxide reductase n=1 Tax=Candidatus Nomurabacteria bacterium GW2011_GWA2_40_9 TaxID=1618734 RepID=A0A0G0TNE0_9BACT|nr:MAG: Alkyl hydroperoxide reductase [Candidatus Nomurabacteria bacterium GW2011_GWA2_40_9]